MRALRRPGWRVGLPVVVLIIAVLGMAPTRGTILELRAGGVTSGPSGAVSTVAPTAPERFVDGTSVLDSADRTDPAVAARINSDRAWLRAGSVPGAGGEFGEMAERALLDLRVLTSETGALMAAPVTAWKHVWPRDASFAVAAYSITGHHAEAVDVLGFLSRVAPADGRWEARYRTDGSGPPDDRPQQLDGSGWVLWALWTFVHTAPDDELLDEVVSDMRLAAVASADAIVESLGDDGLPEPSSDYWEKSENKVTLGVAAPLSAGLRAAVDLAAVLGVDAARWRAASAQLDEAIDERFGAHGYPRTLPGGGDDAAVTFLAPPFAPASEPVRAAVDDAEGSLRVPNGGHRPGEDWTKDVGVAWTPETAMFALALAGHGDRPGAERLLTFLEEHRTPQGSLPEKVDARADPASVAPLAWTSSLVVLALSALDGALPVVPDPN